MPRLLGPATRPCYIDHNNNNNSSNNTNKNNNNNNNNNNSNDVIIKLIQNGESIFYYLAYHGNGLAQHKKKFSIC